MFAIKPKTLHHWYRDHLSDYSSEIASGEWSPKYLEKEDSKMGTILKEKPMYVLKPENIGANMSIDDKCICHEGYTVLIPSCYQIA